MERTGISPFKEVSNENEIVDNPAEYEYTKPSWMINENVYDSIWKVTIVGLDVNYSKDLNFERKISFSKPVSETQLLTDSDNEHLLKDIQNSLLYLNSKGKITRPSRIGSVLSSACHLIRHANEMNFDTEKPKIRLLSEVKFEHLKSYLLDFEVEEQLFLKAIDFILNRFKCRSDIDWEAVKIEFGLSSRKLASLKSKLKTYLEFNNEHFQADGIYKEQFQDASKYPFVVEENLLPSEKTISNEISKLEALYTARPSQIYRFRHSAMDLFAGGKSIFENMASSQKTALMPAHVCLHAISSSLAFCRKFGEALREYFANFARAEKKLILSVGVSEYAHSCSRLQQELFEQLPLPGPLKELKTFSSQPSTAKNLNGEMDNQNFFYQATRLYVAAIFTLLATFTSARVTSLLTLSRDCFVQSPMDRLFDIVLRIPKSSERWQLEPVNRPIPNLIYDYGLEFASFASQVEERRDVFSEDNKSFLFSRSLTQRSLITNLYTSDNTGYQHLKPLSDDTIYAYLSEFTDWSQSRITDSKRWYPKPHQFRRFFAVLYFNFTQDSGLDELSWFMGHADLDQTFHYAEISPTDEWVDEAEATISKIASSLHSSINGDEKILEIVNEARKSCNVVTVIEPLVRKLIDDHKFKNNQQVRFFKIDHNEVFFYFVDLEDDD
jgi:hypothetical protein